MIEQSLVSEHSATAIEHHQTLAVNIKTIKRL